MTTKLAMSQVFSYASLRASQKRSRCGRSPTPPDAMEPLTAGSSVAKRGAPLLARLMLSIAAEWRNTPSGLLLVGNDPKCSLSAGCIPFSWYKLFYCATKKSMNPFLDLLTKFQWTVNQT